MSTSTGTGQTTGWYTNSYGGPFRSTRLRAQSLIPNARIANVAQAQQTLVVDAQRQHTAPGAGEDESKTIKRRETIFGPDVGEDDEPGWTKPDEGQKIDVNVVKGWVEKAKSEEGVHATTTLQALVNLKRPTLLLQQLELEAIQAEQNREQDIAEGEIAPASRSRPNSMLPTEPRHTLKFNYDATTPLVNVSIQVYPSPPPPVEEFEGKEAPSIAEEDPKTVYSGVHGGGFNQVFQLPAEAALDLSSAIAPASAITSNSALALSGGDEKNMASEDTNRSSIERSMGNLQLAQPDLATVPELPQIDTNEERRPARRFGLFPRRNREPDVEAGQIEMQNRQPQEESEAVKPKDPEMGMRLLIRIEAIGPEGQTLKRRNAQLTHILITGMWVPDAGSVAGPGQTGKRVWVVKVVRREAVIGAHTFLLKEIYGLSSSTQTQSPSYPPASGAEDPFASTPNECIVCLTSPRDVVLLPCRHLVVCRECAVGMVEFGAGGKVARRDDNAEADTGAAAGGGGSSTPSAAAAAPPVAGGTTTTGRERRKKKAKGWYCPVCRQPYTSLLRLALPASAKPLRTPAASRMQSRAPSIRSVHTHHSLHRVPSYTPTLPDGAERMLEGLRPAGTYENDDEDEEEDAEAREYREDRENRRMEEERPQFVLGPEVDAQEDKKQSVEHREVAAETSFAETTFVESRDSHEAKRDSKGWKEV